MTPQLWSVGLLAAAALASSCRSYDAADRATARAPVPPRWSTPPLDTECYRLDAPDERCFGPATSPETLGPRSVPPTAPPGSARSEGAWGRWWTAFNDEDLNLLVERALEESPRTQVALARVAQARALARRSRADQFPRLDAELSVSRQRQVLALTPEAFGAPVGPEGFPETFEIGLYSAQLVGRYDPDLFGRIGDEVRAQELEVGAARLNVDDAHLALAAEVSETWFDLVEVRARTRLLRAQLEASRARFELVREMYEAGLSPSLELQQQRREVATALARLATVEGADLTARSRLTALVGVPVARLPVTERNDLPRPTPLPGIGVPADVVLRRPEVRAARDRLEAADRRVGAAVAQRLPALSLQGTVGFGSREISSLFDFVIWSVAATVTQPIWHGGAIDSGVDQARAVLDERLGEYRDAVLRAVAEVETALADLNRTRAELEALQGEVEDARETLFESELLYRQGIADFLAVIDAERGLHGADIELLRARRAWLSARVQLHRALGGEAGASGAPARSPPRSSHRDTGRARSNGKPR